MAGTCVRWIDHQQYGVLLRRGFGHSLAVGAIDLPLPAGRLLHFCRKFTRKPDGEVLAMKRIEEIHRRIPDCHLVMHGSSSVPQDLQDEINRYGGKIKQTWGVPVEEIQRGIKNGVRKINIDTDNRMAITGQIRRVLQENPSEFDPRKYLKPAMDAMTKLCKQRFEEFGTAGKASKIGHVHTLADMAKLYGAGKLDPVFG